ncbi:hypothetical protein F5B22DRAFT_651933 [Xylaria bambusicola]|uniref:uncharacterized protein n=1 Tax=Xylaria bambusicola TaxID=326684 RepID=UPI002008C362|nr:uncharacterized protein F5B22DRAFT_651933 [Xylaria bambusicola]KAI0505195.1 hypothetical protein F5B22DRAFT_651933 [Xylaria bambusicola]
MDMAASTKLQAPSIPQPNDPDNSSEYAEGDNTTPPKSENKHSIGWSLSRWKWEIMGMALSFSSFAASITLLAVYHGRRVDSWNAPFTLNTFISILAQTARTSLAFGVGSCLGQAKWNVFSTRSGNLALFEAFDEASKGPWGSLSLLYRLRSWSLVIVGASVITSLLGYEPFIQASITQYGKLDKEPTSSVPRPSISQARRLDIGSLSFDTVYFNRRDTAPYLVYVQGADLGLLTSVYEGLSVSNMTVALPHSTCPTGNCTYGSFASLGICSSCVDVTSYIVADRQQTIPGETVYTLPWKLDSNFSLSTSSLIKNLGSCIFTSQVEKTISFNNTLNSTTFAVFGFLQPASNHTFYQTNTSTLENVVPKATECGLYYCTNVYSSTILEGTLNETLVASMSNRDMSSYEPYDPTVAAPHTLYQQFDYPRSDLQLFIPEKEAKQLGLTDDHTLRFNISQATIQSISYLLGRDISEEPSFIPDSTGSVLVQSIGASKDLNAKFRAIAESMTIYLRGHDYEGSAHYGVSQRWVLHYRIRWEFLLPPLSLTLAGCFFVMYTIWETQSLGLMAWKQSTLATLAHGLDAWTRARMREAYLNNTEDKSAKDISVKAERFRGGIELCEAPSSDASEAAPYRDSRVV